MFVPNTNSDKIKQLFMGFFSFFSTDKNAKIESIRKQIESYKFAIDVEKGNIARARNSPRFSKNQIEGSLRRIEHAKLIISKCTAELTQLKK